MTVDDGKARTDRYAESGVETVWVTPKVPSWFFEIPGLQVSEDSDALSVHRGCLSRRGFHNWQRPDPFEFSRFVRALASSKLTVQTLRCWHSEELPYGQSTTLRSFTNPVAWVKPAEWETEATAQAKSDAEDEREERQRELHAQRVRDLNERQQRLAPLVVQAAERATGWVARAGDPRARGDIPASSRTYAFGVPVFVQTNGTDQLWAVVCPVESRIGSWARHKWKGVTVFVDSEAERRRLVTALHDEVRVQLL
ncbi:MAG: hypothetical protein ACE37B_11115 [Ilumatobacter sp.]|uniref:hypothetical protein n=1 Tax=Ilumatobacter sp. TaxID=1967498 RepID=UPI00391D9379